MKSNRHRAEVIEIFENGSKAAAKFTSGRVECVVRMGTNPAPFYVGEKGLANYVLTPSTGRWVFERRVRKSYSNYSMTRRNTAI